MFMFLKNHFRWPHFVKLLHTGIACPCEKFLYEALSSPRIDLCLSTMCIVVVELSFINSHSSNFFLFIISIKVILAVCVGKQYDKMNDFVFCLELVSFFEQA